MAAVLHLFTSGVPDALALEAMRAQIAAGDRVTVVLAGEDANRTPAVPGASVHRVPDDLGWDALLDRIFEADQVIAW